MINWFKEVWKILKCDRHDVTFKDVPSELKVGMVLTGECKRCGYVTTYRIVRERYND